MSSSGLSPTMTASWAATSARCRAAPKIAGEGLARPISTLATATST
jgi:hypothetical protein